MSETAPLQLLLVEDNPGDARYIEELLADSSELSQRVRERADGSGASGATQQAIEQDGPVLHHETRLEDGLTHLEEHTVDAVLLDLDLPDSAGLETLERLQERVDVPVIVLTGHSDREVGTAALREGAEEYLVKDEINGDLLVRSLYHAIERRAHERTLKRHEVLLEESTDVNAILDPEGVIQYITPSVESVLGYVTDDLVGEDAFEYVHPDDREQTGDSLEAVLASESAPPVEFRFRHADGHWVILEGRGRNLRDDPLVEGIAVYTRDVTERVEQREQLERQREHLAALNDLNAVVREINEALIDQSTREEVQQLVVDRLADSDSYRFAWIGSADLRSGEVELLAEGGVEGYLDDLTISIDEDDETGQGPTARAVRTGEMQVDDVEDDPAYEQWRDRARDLRYQSSAAIPIAYQGTLYGVLNVYADRPNAFEGQEGTVVGQLGGTVGHAINAIERKQVLVSDEVLEVEFTAQQYLDAHGIEAGGGTITFNRAVPIGGGQYVLYGTATEEGLGTLDALVEAIDNWEDVTVKSAGDTHSFELDVSQPPIVSRLAERGGRLHRAVLEDGAFHLVVHLPPGADVRQIAELIAESLPDAQLIAQRQISPEARVLPSLSADLEERLTVRQQNVLEAAYYAGFFEWPREQNGEEIADSLDVSAPTFHQHLRAGERKLLESVFEER